MPGPWTTPNARCTSKWLLKTDLVPGPQCSQDCCKGQIMLNPCRIFAAKCHVHMQTSGHRIQTHETFALGSGIEDIFFILFWRWDSEMSKMPRREDENSTNKYKIIQSTSHIKLPNWIQMAQTGEAQNEVLGNLLVFCLKVKQKRIAMCWAWLPSTESEWDHVWPYQPYATSLFFMLSTFQYILTKLFAPALLIKTKTNRCKQAFGSFAFLHEAHLEMKGSLRCPNWKQHHGFASCNVRTIRAHTEKLLGSPLMLYRIIHGT